MQRLQETAATTDFKVAKPVDGLCKPFGGLLAFYALADDAGEDRV